MEKYVLCVVLGFCLLLSLTACKQEAPVETAPTTESTALAETTEGTAEPVWLEDNVEGKVCVGFLPTEAGSWRYAVIEDQEAAVASYVKASSAIYSDEWWIKGDRTMGLFVEYEGMVWEFVESGEMVYSLGRVKAEDAADLYALCAEAARETGWQDTVPPERLTGIISATLRRKGNEYPLTDGAALDKLEAMLTGSQYVLGGTGCPFNALLDLELETGETLTIALATDSCGAWMSEGYYYEYGKDSQPLYDLFGVTVEEL